MLQQLFKAIRSENIKSRHSKSWLIVLLFGGFLPMAMMIVMFFRPNAFIQGTDFSKHWYNVFWDGNHVFALLFLSLGIVIFSAQVNSVEHRNHTWQLIETQPLRKRYIYIAKYLRVLKLILLEIIAYVVFCLVCGLVGYYVLDAQAHNYDLKVAWSPLFQMILNLFFGASSFAALFFVLNINIKKTNLLTGFGLVSVIGYLISKGFFPNPSTFIPIVQLEKSGSGISQIGEWVTFYARLSFVMSLIILILGFFFYKYKNYNTLFLKNKKTLLSFLAVILVGGAIAYYVNMPRVQKSYGHTIVNGKIQSEDPIDSIYVMNADNLILTMIPVNKDGSFHVNLDSVNVANEMYLIGMPSSGQVFMNVRNEPLNFFLSNKDSIYIDATVLELGRSTAKSSGDRRAETMMGIQLMGNGFNSSTHILERSSLSDDAKTYFIEILEDEYNSALKMANSYTTIDGLQLSKDIEDRNKTLLGFYALDNWYKFENKIDDTITKPAFILNIEKNLNADDVTLINDRSVKTFLYTKYNDGKLVKNDLDYVTIAIKIDNAEIKEAMLYDALKRVLENNVIEDSVAVQTAQSHLNQITTFKYRFAIGKVLNSRISATNFDVIPAFEFKDNAGNVQSLEQFRGKYVVIDVWATWCGPCMQEAPYFATLAEKYKDKNVVFVSICTDRIDFSNLNIAADKPNVIGWNAEWNAPFMNYFAVESIPRFIMIGPDGRPINHKMPRPSESNFEILMKQYMQ